MSFFMESTILCPFLDLWEAIENYALLLGLLVLRVVGSIAIAEPAIRGHSNFRRFWLKKIDPDGLYIHIYVHQKWQFLILYRVYIV